MVFRSNVEPCGEPEWGNPFVTSRTTARHRSYGDNENALEIGVPFRTEEWGKVDLKEVQSRVGTRLGGTGRSSTLRRSHDSNRGVTSDIGIIPASMLSTWSVAWAMPKRSRNIAIVRSTMSAAVLTVVLPSIRM